MPDTTASQHLDWFSFTDLPKIQTLTPLKSQKTEGFETTGRAIITDHGVTKGANCATVQSATTGANVAVRASVLTDHLVRLEEQRRGKRDPEGLSRLQVEHQLELAGLLHRQ